MRSTSPIHVLKLISFRAPTSQSSRSEFFSRHRRLRRRLFQESLPNSVNARRGPPIGDTRWEFGRIFVCVCVCACVAVPVDGGSRLFNGDNTPSQLFPIVYKSDSGIFKYFPSFSLPPLTRRNVYTLVLMLCQHLPISLFWYSSVRMIFGLFISNIPQHRHFPIIV